MAFKPNYNQQRAERNRLKQAKKDAKLREREETRRKGQDAAAPEAASPAVAPPERSSLVAADSEEPHGS